MDIDITCFEAFEYLNDSIDGTLDPSMRSALEAHLSQCKPCRIERALTVGARSTVRTHMKREVVPADVRARIIASVIPGTAKPRTAGVFAGLFGLPGWRIPLAFGGALAIALIALLLVNRKPGHSHTHEPDGSVITESFNHFDEVLDGRLQPDIRSDNPLVVQKYLEERLHFPVRMSPMREFRLVGANVGTVDNETTANFIYERNGELVYITQSDARSLIHNNRRFIPGPVLDALTASGWYTKSAKMTDCTLAMWLADSTLCTAIGDIKEDLLLANLTEARVP